MPGCISHNSAAVNSHDSTNDNGAIPVPLAEVKDYEINQQKSYRVSSIVCNYFSSQNYLNKISITKVNLCL